MIGKDSDVEGALQKFAQLTTQEGRLVSATVLSLVNQVLGVLGDHTEGTHGVRLCHDVRADQNSADDTGAMAGETIRKMLVRIGDVVEKLEGAFN